ncbi:MAG: DNA-3-methyladenine glycosylase I [Luteibacter sp.]|uniref:DNA-3-methyladenine glycosylase I n=1 Tax=Luteibacter sp. TaxID=1886636 RepID=UPI0028098F57|nr:DNA-3-methyladenine glycosylase I [Luteibacter sp.]MDQ7997422.1 DNA-3-methyladenine glycosylase I [Luteibacter sp.]MDQ8048352.1 DNA-3-methyladenine glycosylase I [Luteibacter sp.]
MSDGRCRCAWGETDDLLRGYHDREWGVPERDGRRLWEKLVLDGFQAGLSWRTILARRDGFRQAFEGFDPDVVAAYGPREIERLLADPGIIRSRSKIGAAIGNAKAYVAMREAGEDFAGFCWNFVGGDPMLWEGPVPPNSPLSEQASRALKKRGFTFVGPTIVFAWMEATGMINSHAPDCFRRAELSRKPLPDKG